MLVINLLAQLRVPAAYAQLTVDVEIRILLNSSDLNNCYEDMTELRMDSAHSLTMLSSVDTHATAVSQRMLCVSILSPSLRSATRTCLCMQRVGVTPSLGVRSALAFAPGRR